jgi:hypothetical protein
MDLGDNPNARVAITTDRDDGVACLWRSEEAGAAAAEHPARLVATARQLDLPYLPRRGASPADGGLAVGEAVRSLIRGHLRDIYSSEGIVGRLAGRYRGHLPYRRSLK